MTRVRLLEQTVEIHQPSLFKTGGKAALSQLVERVKSVNEISSFTLEPGTGKIRLGFRSDQVAGTELLHQLQSVLLDPAAKSAPRSGETYTTSAPFACWTRQGAGFEPLALSIAERGQLVFKDPRLSAPSAPLAARLSEAFATRAGIRGVIHQPEQQEIILRFNPNRLDVHAVVALVLDTLNRDIPLSAVADPNKVPMAVSTTTLGLGTIGQLLIPAATPLAAGLLVATNFHAVRDAAGQLTRGKVGVPLFHTALLACSIATGQVLAFALTDWSLRYWQRRWRNQLVQKTEDTLEAACPTLIQVRHIGEDGVERLLSPQTIRIGDRLRIVAGDMIPADGRVIEGRGLVDESALSGASFAVRRQAPMTVLAGTRLIAGQIDFIVEATGENTRAAELAGRIRQMVSHMPLDPQLKDRIQQLGDKTALPVLATASVGWAVGSLITVGAILHQDWVTGPYFAVPLVTLHHLREALTHGIVMQHPSALLRLADINFLVIDGEDPALRETGLIVGSLSAPLTQSQALLQAVIGAGLYLGDLRTPALLRLAEEQGIPLKRPNLVSLAKGSVDALEGRHRIHLESPTENSLSVEIDGKDLGQIVFQPAPEPAAVDLVRMAQRLGLEVFLMSQGAEEETEKRAHQLGIPLHGGGLDSSAKQQFLEGLRQRGVRFALVGAEPDIAPLAPLAEVTLAVGPLEGVPVERDFVSQGGYGPLAGLLAQTQHYLPDIRESNRKALVPNLLCVAGAFGGLLNGITSGIIANVAVANVDRSLSRKLEKSPSSNAQQLVSSSRP